MTDSEHQDRQTVAFPASNLTRRLLRRATEPIGVIDVRHPAELHSRSSLWLGQRLELLDNLKSRYGLDQGAGGAGGTGSPIAGGMSLIAPLQRTAAMGTVSEVSSAEQYRVKRPSRHAEPNPPKPLSAETVATQSAAAGEIRVSTNSIPAMHLQRKTSETQSPVSSKPDPSAPPLVRATPVGTSGHLDNKFAHGHDASLTGGPLPQVSELPHSAVVAQLHLQRKPDGSTAAEEIGPFSTPHSVRPASTREELPDDDASTLSSPSTSDLHLQRKADHPPTLPVAAEEIGRLSTPHDFRPASMREDLPGDGAPTLSSPSASGLLLQRKADHPPPFPAASSGPTAEAVTAPPPASINSQSRGPVSAEIRAAPLLPGSTSIVWRKADTNGASRESATPGLATVPTYTNGTQIMREAASESVSSSSVAPVATPTSGSNGADVTRLAEQVSRMIARQLKIERERRGGTR